MEIPIARYYLAGPDLFFRVVEGWESVSMSKPENANQEHGKHENRDPPIDPRAPSGERLKIFMAHKGRSGER